MQGILTSFHPHRSNLCLLHAFEKTHQNMTQIHGSEWIVTTSSIINDLTHPQKITASIRTSQNTKYKRLFLTWAPKHHRSTSHTHTHLKTVTPRNHWTGSQHRHSSQDFKMKRLEKQVKSGYLSNSVFHSISPLQGTVSKEFKNRLFANGECILQCLKPTWCKYDSPLVPKQCAMVHWCAEGFCDNPTLLQYTITQNNYFLMHYISTLYGPIS